MVVWALTWLVKTAFWVPGACQEIKNLKPFKLPYSNERPIRCRMSLENPLLRFHKIKHQISIHCDLSVCCQNVHTTQCKIDIVIISEDGKIIHTSMTHFLLLLLRNATKHNSFKFCSARLHVSSDKFWNRLKDLKCNNVINLVCWWTSGLYVRLN